MRAPIDSTIPTASTPSPSMTSMRRILPGLAALATLATVAACSDAPSAPQSTLAPSAAPVQNTVSRLVSQQITATVGDTVITVFEVGTNTANGTTFNLGHTSKIEFPYSAGSICDPARSSYGAGTWNSACPALTTPIRITARVWKNAQGKVATDFQPALRFVPGLRKGVTLTIKDAATAGTRIDFCTLSGCIDESLADPSLKTVLDNANGFATRTIKHFSGYQIILGRESESSEMY